MAMFRKAASILGRTVSSRMNLETSVPKPSILQAIRCMSTSKVFVGGLSYNTDEQVLRESFDKYGQVIDAKVIVDRESGRSRGFGFVTFTSPEEASAAIQALDQQELDGRLIKVNYANERPPRNFGGEGGGYGGGGYGGGGYGGGGYGGGGGSYGSGGGSYGGGGGSYGSGGSGYGGGGGNYGSGGGGYSGGGGNYGSGGGGYSGGGGSYGSGGGGYSGGGGSYGSGGGGYSGGGSASGAYGAGGESQAGGAGFSDGGGDQNFGGGGGGSYGSNTVDAGLDNNLNGGAEEGSYIPENYADKQA